MDSKASRKLDPKFMEDLRQFGDRTSSFITAYPGFKSFESDGYEGRIQYVETKKVLIAATEPLTPRENRTPFLKDFFDTAKKRGKTGLACPVSEQLSKDLVGHGYHRIQVGAEPVFELEDYFSWELDPLDFFPRAKSLRRRGARVLEVSAEEFEKNPRFSEMTQQWLSSRKTAPLGFLSQVAPALYKEHKRVFAIEVDKKIQAFVAATPVYPVQGYYFADMIQDRPLKTGTNELLLIEAMRILKNEGVKEVRLGICPLANITGNESRWNSVFRWIFEKSHYFYGFKSLFQFKEKFNPTRWDPLFLVSDRKIHLRSMAEVLKIHLPGGVIKKKKLSSALDPSITLPKKPKKITEWIGRAPITLSFATLFVLLHFLRMETVWGHALFQSSHFWSQSWTLKGLFIGPLFHNHLWHLTGDTTTFLAFVGIIEYLRGSKFAFWVVGAGLWLSNPVTVAFLDPILRLASTEHYQLFLSKSDIGASNAVYAAAGAFSGMLLNPLWILIPLGVNAVMYTYVAAKWLAIHHLVALAMGYFLARRWARHRS